MEMELVTIVGGEQLMAHAKDNCLIDPCSIHSPSEHHMSSWPQHWRWAPPYDYRRIMERICEHGIGHPDPDDMKIQLSIDAGIHGCDGCCVEPGETG